MNAAIPWTMRGDLVCQAEGNGRWLIKDPISMAFLILESQEYQILQQLNGRRTAQELLAQINSTETEENLFSIADLKDLVLQFATHRLITRTMPGDSARLQPSRTSVLRIVSGVFRIRIPLFNPAYLIDPWLPAIKTVLSPISLRLAMAWVVFAFGLLLFRMDTFVSELPLLFQLQGPTSLLLLFIVFMVIKALHEMGHAVAARMYNSECNECGIMLLFFTPVLYTNVSDGWTCERQQRIAITMAGIGTELIIAATCSVLWSLSLPGITRLILMNAIVICTINTLLFNGNPLLRFDGYFVLSDWLNVPNLAARSGQIVRQQCLVFLTGLKQSIAADQQPLLAIYGWAALVYRVFLCIGIINVIRLLASSWNQQWIGQILIFIMLSGSIVLPLIQFSKELKNVVVHQQQQHRLVNWLRPLIVMSGLVGLSLIPLPKTVVVPAYIDTQCIPVFTANEGQLHPIARYGTLIKKDSLIAEQNNSALEAEIAEWQSRVAELKTRIELLVGNPLTANAESLPTLQESLQAASEKLTNLRADKQNLKIHSPVDGVLIPPRWTPATVNKTLPVFWSGLPLQPLNHASWMPQGTLLGYVGQQSDWQLIACVDEKTLELLKPGQKAKFYTASSSELVMAQVIAVGRLPMDELPAAMQTTGLGFGTPTKSGFIPSETTYAVILEPSNPNSVPFYSVGSVKIQVNRQSTWQRLRSFLQANFGR